MAISVNCYISSKSSRFFSFSLETKSSATSFDRFKSRTKSFSSVCVNVSGVPGFPEQTYYSSNSSDAEVDLVDAKWISLGSTGTGTSMLWGIGLLEDSKFG